MNKKRRALENYTRKRSEKHLFIMRVRQSVQKRCDCRFQSMPSCFMMTLGWLMEDPCLTNKLAASRMTPHWSLIQPFLQCFI